jgi:hypothetical protein
MNERGVRPPRRRRATPGPAVGERAATRSPGTRADDDTWNHAARSPPEGSAPAARMMAILLDAGVRSALAGQDDATSGHGPGSRA